jgi:Mn2+/Fe2+ NRAMP family transporter
MIVMMLMTSNKSITGGLRLPTPQKAIGWIATGVMFAVAACMLASLI